MTTPSLITDDQIERVKNLAYDEQDMRLVRLCMVAENEIGPLGDRARERIIGEIKGRYAYNALFGGRS